MNTMNAMNTDTNNDRPTPITDEVLRRNAASDQTPKEDYEILALHAADLERQLAEAREIIAMYRESKASLPEYSSQRELRRHLAEVTAQRDILAEFARNVAATSSSSRLRREAKAALAAVKGGAS